MRISLISINVGFMMQLSVPTLIDSILEQNSRTVDVNVEVWSVLFAC